MCTITHISCTVCCSVSTVSLKVDFCPFQLWLFQYALHRLPYQWSWYFHDGSRPVMVSWYYGIDAPGAHWVFVMGKCLHCCILFFKMYFFTNLQICLFQAYCILAGSLVSEGGWFHMIQCFSWHLTFSIETVLPFFHSHLISCDQWDQEECSPARDIFLWIWYV